MCKKMIVIYIISIITIILKDCHAITTEIFLEGDMILGPGNLQLKCRIKNPDTIRVRDIFVESFIEGDFVEIADFFLPDENLNAALTPAGRYLENRTILSNPKMPDMNGQYETNMTFINIACEDNKRYRCHVRHLGSERDAFSNETTIFVKDRPNKPDSTPSRDPIFNLCPGMNVNFTCNGNIGRPPGYYQWTKFSNGSYTTYKADTTVTCISDTCHCNGSSTLSIEVQKEDNNAIFKCEVVHELSTNDTHQQTLPEDFIYDPIENMEITKVPQRQFYDQTIASIELTCSANSCHHPTITWHKDSDLNTTIGNESVYIISDVIEENSGTYICKINVIDIGTEYNQTDSVFIEIRSFTDSDQNFAETVVGIVTITLVSVAITALTSFTIFKIVQKSRHLRMINTIHAKDVEPVVNRSDQTTHTTPNIEDEGFQSEVSQQ